MKSRGEYFREHWRYLAKGCVVFGLLLLLGIWLVWTGVVGVMLAVASNDWPSVEGVVKSSKVVMSTHRDIDNYEYEGFSPVVRYRYEVDRLFYESERLTVVGNVGGKKSSERTVKQYPVGQKITVYYNPEDVSYSLVEREKKTAAYFVPFVGMFFVVIGLSGVFVVVKFYGMLGECCEEKKKGMMYLVFKQFNKGTFGGEYRNGKWIPGKK